jgi:hypothetical protein
LPVMKHATRRPVSRRAVFIGAAVLASLAAVTYSAHALSSGTARPDQAAATAPTITGVTVDAPYVQPEYTSAHGRNGGDTWYNTWADDGNIYATSDDTSGYSDNCPNGSNLAVNELTGTNPSNLANPYTNCMTSYGGAADKGDYGDGATWKTEGIISVGNTLYLVVTRQKDVGNDYPYGYQVSTDASIVSSADDGQEWSNGYGLSDDPGGAAPPPQLNSSGTAIGAKSMFPSAFTTPQFINYGEADNTASTADGGDQYVYAMSNDGFAYDGSYEILGRVLRSEIGELSAADWQFYTGPSGGDGTDSTDSTDWTSYANIGSATHLISASHQLSHVSIVYDPGLGEYLLATFAYPFAPRWNTDQTTWAFYSAPHPWGPWTQFFSSDTDKCYVTCQDFGNGALGLYDPAFVSKFITEDGLGTVIFSSGDFSHPFRVGDFLYQLHAYPVTLSTSTENLVDDSVAGTFSSGWSDDWDFAGYSDETDHYAPAALTSSGACASTQPSVSYTFTGTSIAWVGSMNDNHGIADVSIDGGPPVQVDTYAPTWEVEQVLYSDTGLASGSHTITITVTCNKNASSSGTYEDVDAFIVGT